MGFGGAPATVSTTEECRHEEMQTERTGHLFSSSSQEREAGGIEFLYYVNVYFLFIRFLFL